MKSTRRQNLLAFALVCALAATTAHAQDGLKSLCRSVDHLRSLPVKNPGELPVIPVYERAAEVRAIKVG
jgi:5'-nucleotidase/UDP-sugar diphosphatase